jgi:hypothetical protein
VSESGWMSFDAVVREQPSHGVEVTQYPVELGASLIDHIRPKPVTMQLQVVVTNSPARRYGLSHLDGIRALEKETVQIRQPIFNAPPELQVPTSVTGIPLTRTVPVEVQVRTWSYGETHLRRVENILAELKQAMHEARAFSIECDLLGGYQSMLLTDISTQRDGDSGNSLKLDLAFTQVLFAEFETRNVSALLAKKKRAVTPRSAPPKDEGKQVPEEVEDDATKRSFAKQHGEPSDPYYGAPI